MKNYDNEYGKCLPSGQCQMPVSTSKIGYHFKKKIVNPNVITVILKNGDHLLN